MQEAYCVTLNQLKEAMEEPQQESMAFINLMYSQLDDLLLDIPSTSKKFIGKYIILSHTTYTIQNYFIHTFNNYTKLFLLPKF